MRLFVYIAAIGAIAFVGGPAHAEHVKSGLSATTPSITWKLSSLPPNSKVKTSSVATTNSKGKKSWKVSGNCSLSGSHISTKPSGRCSVTFTIAAQSPFGSRSSHKSLPISSPTVVANSFDPYAGVAASVDSIGTKSERTLATPDGRVRRYRLYIPNSVSAGATVPLVIALHGGLGYSSQFEANSGLDGFAESNKFIAVYPDGVGIQPDGTGYQSWNGGYCCGFAATQNIDDVTFIRNLVADLRRTLPINEKRVYAIGHSNGGILSYKLACELSDVVVAIGVQAGSNVVSNCHPAFPVSIFHLHGTGDTNVPINGGKGSGVSGTTFVSARSSVDAMVTVDRCSDSTPKSLVATNSDIAALSWTQCASNTEVRLVTVKGATHAWMGHPSQTANSAAYVGVPYANLDATRAILSFLLSKTR